MKSKTSFFNLSIYRKNLVQFWPIWAGYLFIFVIVLPGKLWVDLRNCLRYDDIYNSYHEQMIATIGNDMNLEYFIPFVFIGAIVIATALFSYLYSSKSANMIHALPVTREELFGTNVITGLTIMWFPPLVAFCASVIICLNFGVTCVEYLGLWFLTMLAVSFLAFAIACLCAMAAGQIVAVPLYYGFINYAYYVAKIIVCNMVSYLGFGISLNYTNAVHKLPILDAFFPIDFLRENVFFAVRYVRGAEYDVCDHLDFVGGFALLGYLLPALLMYVVSYFMYKYRKMENTGEVLVISFLRPLIYFALGILSGFGISVWSRGFLEELIGYVPNYLFILIALIAGIIGFFLAKMLIKRKFKIFVPRTWLEGGVFLVLIIIVYGAAFGYAHFQEKLVPQKRQIQMASILMGGDNVVYKGEEAQTVLDVHREIVDRSNFYRRLMSYETYEYVVIAYQFTDGTIVNREYRIPFCEESENVINKIYSEERNPQNFIDSIFMLEDPDEITFDGGSITVYNESGEYARENSFDKYLAKEFVKAIILDSQSGALQKYNLYNPYMNTGNQTTVSIYLGAEGYEDSKLVQFWDYAKYGEVWMRYDEAEKAYLDRSIYLEIGPECTNLVALIRENGLIDQYTQIKVLE